MGGKKVITRYRNSGQRSRRNRLRLKIEDKYPLLHNKLYTLYFLCIFIIMRVIFTKYAILTLTYCIWTLCTIIIDKRNESKRFQVSYAYSTIAFNLLTTSVAGSLKRYNRICYQSLSTSKVDDYVWSHEKKVANNAEKIYIFGQTQNVKVERSKTEQHSPLFFIHSNSYFRPNGVNEPIF